MLDTISEGHPVDLIEDTCRLVLVKYKKFLFKIQLKVQCQ